MKKTLLSLAALFLALALLTGCALSGNASGSKEKTGRVFGAKTTAADPTQTRSDPQTDPVTEPETASETLPVTEPETLPVTETAKRRIEVVDQLDYHKQVVTADYVLEIGEDFSNMEHSIRVPALAGIDTAGSRAFNRKLADLYSETLTLLQNGEEDNILYFVDYSSFITDGAVAILMKNTSGVQCGGIGNSYCFYYFDADADRELDFDGYLEKLGMDRETVAGKLGGVNEYLEYVDFVKEFDETVTSLPLTADMLEGAAFDADKTAFVISSPYLMEDSSMLIETGPAL